MRIQHMPISPAVVGAYSPGEEPRHRHWGHLCLGEVQQFRLLLCIILPLVSQESVRGMWER